METQLTHQIEQLTKERDGLVSELSTLKLSKDKLENETKSLSQLKTALITDTQSRESFYTITEDTLKSMISELQVTIKDLSSSKDKLIAEVAHLEQRKADFYDHVKEANEFVSRITSVVDIISKSIATIETSSISTKNQFIVSMQELRTFVGDLNKAHQEFVELNSTIKKEYAAKDASYVKKEDLMSRREIAVKFEEERLERQFKESLDK